ncbi:MAG: hypothetical protein AAGG01_14630, partial [Planctomycetota bacterium]
MLRELAAAAFLVVYGAGCSIGPRYVVYGTDLEVREGARLLAWAADETYETFRYVVERREEGADRIRTFRFSQASQALLQHAPVAGAALLLPPDVTPAQRTRAEALIGRLGPHDPAM